MSSVLLITKWNNETKIVEKYLEFGTIQDAKDHVKKHDIEKLYPDYFISNKPKKVGTWFVDEEKKRVYVDVFVDIEDLKLERDRRLAEDLILDLSGEYGKQTFKMATDDVEKWQEVLAYALTLKATSDFYTEVSIQTKDSYITMTHEFALDVLKQVFDHRQKIFNAYFKMKNDGIPKDYIKDKYWK